MKTTVKMVLLVVLGLLLTAALASLGMAVIRDAADPPRGVHLQSPKRVPELVKKTHEIGSVVLTDLEAYQAYMNRGQVMEIGVPGS